MMDQSSRDALVRDAVRTVQTAHRSCPLLSDQYAREATALINLTAEVLELRRIARLAEQFAAGNQDGARLIVALSSYNEHWGQPAHDDDDDENKR